MWMWLHHLFNPHCLQCAEERADKAICQGCENLKMQLAVANDEKRQMLASILSFAKKEQPEATATPVDYEKFKPRMMTWNVRKQMLEAEDRAAAALLRKQQAENPQVEKVKQDIEELEKELGVEDAKA